MTVQTWPTSLRKPNRKDYMSQRQDGRQRKSNGGPPGFRSRFSSTATNVSMTVNLSRSDLAVFDRFYDDLTGGGTLPFYMPDPTTDNWPMLSSSGQPLLTGSGQPILLSARWLCLFGDDTPVEAIVGVRFNISFSVWVMP